MILKEGAQPVFLKARPIPYSLREKVERELDRLQKDGVISRVDWSDWATPIVVVPKPNGTIRLCGDFKMTINPVLKVDEYPLPKMDDIFAALGKGVFFSKIDLQWAYLHIHAITSTYVNYSTTTCSYMCTYYSSIYDTMHQRSQRCFLLTCNIFQFTNEKN